MASAFDPEVFIQTQYKEALDTRYVPCPPGEFVAMVQKLNLRKAEDRWVMDVTWDIQDEAIKKKTGVEKLMARQGLFLDLTEQGQLDFGKGKNVPLGRLREELSQNKAGRAWAPNMLLNAIAYVMVEHSTNPNDPENPYVNVTRISKEKGGTQKKSAKTSK